MSADYSSDSLGAYNSIKDAGVQITLKRFTPGTYTPASDSYSQSSWTTDSTYGVLVQYSHRFVDGTRIKVGDQKVIFSSYGLSFTVQVGDKVVIDSEEWNVVNAGPIAPSNDPIIYKAQIRRAG